MNRRTPTNVALDARMRRGDWWLAGTLLVFTVLASPRHMVDADVLSNLATGRWIVTHHAVPYGDPFTFAAPTDRWSNPEWLGDVLWYGLYAWGGETALQVFKFFVIAAALGLTLLWARRRGARLPVAMLLLLVLLPACVARFTLRNHLHSFWLVPAYLLLVEAAHRRRLWWAVLLGLAWLWTNLHSSFLLGWGVLVAALLERAGNKEPVQWSSALLVLALHPLLPLLGPQGLGAYAQLWDHLGGAPVYRHFISEWRTPLESPALLALLPLHLVAAAALLSFVPAANRRRWPALFFVLLGLAMAYTSRRFIPLCAVLVVPVLAGNLAGLAGRWPRCVGYSLALTAFVYTACATAVIARRWPAHILQRHDGPTRAVAFLHEQAPPGTRLFNSFNAGPWLLWNSSPRFKHYIDPRNNHGQRLLRQYVSILRQPRLLIATGATMAMLPLAESQSRTAIAHLDDEASGWQLVFLDGYYAVYARRMEQNAALLRRSSFQLLRAQRAFDFAGLSRAPYAAQLLGETERLRAHSPTLGAAYAACLRLARPLPRQEAVDAVSTLHRAAVDLPPAAGLAGCLALGFARAGRPGEGQMLLERARTLFPGDTELAKLTLTSP